MRTLAFIAAILLLALLAQAEPLRETADEDPGQDEPVAENQEVEVSFGEEKRSAQNASDVTRTRICYCRILFCFFGERRSGTCTHTPIAQNLCCRP